MRVSLWVPCWTNYQTYQGNPCGVYPDLSSFTGSGVIQKLYSLYQAIRSYSGSHHLVSELRLWIQVLSYPNLFLCIMSRFVFLSLFYYFCSYLHLVSFLFASCALLFAFLFLFLSCSCSCFLCLLHFVSKKKLQKFWKKKLSVWSLNTKLRHLEVFFL